MPIVNTLIPIVNTLIPINRTLIPIRPVSGPCLRELVQQQVAAAPGAAPQRAVHRRIRPAEPHIARDDGDRVDRRRRRHARPKLDAATTATWRVAARRLGRGRRVGATQRGTVRMDRDWAQPTPRLRRDWARPIPHLRRDCAHCWGDALLRADPAVGDERREDPAGGGRGGRVRLRRLRHRPCLHRRARVLPRRHAHVDHDDFLDEPRRLAAALHPIARPTPPARPLPPLRASARRADPTARSRRNLTPAGRGRSRQGTAPGGSGCRAWRTRARSRRPSGRSSRSNASACARVKALPDLPRERAPTCNAQQPVASVTALPANQRRATSYLVVALQQQPSIPRRRAACPTDSPTRPRRVDDAARH
jgi:hypothetical protein